MKLSKRVMKVIEERQQSAEWTAKIGARAESGDPTLPQHFTEDGRGASYYYGMRDGAHSVIESLLIAHGAYRGYSEMLCDKGQARWNQYLL